MVATGNLRYIGMIKLTGFEISESELLILCRAKGRKGAPMLDLQAFVDEKSVSGRG